MNSYTVRMIQGTDTCTTETVVKAQSAKSAVMEAEMMWVGITVKVINVGLEGECCYEEVDCEEETHYCRTCERHLESDGTCFNCE